MFSLRSGSQGHPLAVAFVLVELIQLVQSQLVSTGFSAVFNDINYYISPYAVGNVSLDLAVLNSASSVHGFYPVTVIQKEIGVEQIACTVKSFAAMDDVFQDAFLQAIILPSVQTGNAITSNNVTFNLLALDSLDIPSGPYFLEASTGLLYQTFRLYSDFTGAFSEPLLQTPEGSFTSLSAQIPGTASVTIGVPSRLYYTRTNEKPLAGVRVAVKDLFDLAGVRTSNGNRAWWNLYPPASVTAPAIQRLIDAGAIIVGKQKLSQFANGEQATADWVDYHSPFNPRGDGYQDPSSSSSGAGASVAAYEWLDVAVGSDTGGSIRGPAMVQGLFGNRPSHGLVELTNAMPLSPTLDTVGFLTRDPEIWDAAQAVIYGANYTDPALSEWPKQIYTWPSYPTNGSASNSSAILVNFVDKLSSFLNAPVTPVNLTTLWNETRPRNITSSLNTLLNLTYAMLITKEQTELVRDPFFRDYAAAHDGRTPFVDPPPLARWAFGDSYPTTALNEARNNKTLFMNWFNTQILPRSGSPARCSDSIFVYVGSTGGDGTVNYRNRYLSPPAVPFGFSSGRMSVFAEVPDSVYPLGQTSYFSNITKHEEYLPVTVGVLVAKGCDGVLAKLSQRLVEEGILQLPLTGRTVLGGDILMKKRAAEQGIQELRYIG